MGDITQGNKWYMSVTYDEAKKIMDANFHQMSMNFIAIGFYLKHVRNNEMYLEDGYKSIWDFAKDRYGLSRSAAKRWMEMNDMYSQDGNSPVLADQYKNFSKSQLQEMLYLTDEQAAEVTEDMTVKQIRELRRPAEDKPQKPYEKHGCITGWSRYPEFCSCCGHGGAECCSQCNSDTCNSRCGWVNDPYLPEAEKPDCATSHNPAKQPAEALSAGAEEQTKEKACTRYDGYACNIEEAVKKHFTRKGSIEGCAACCAICSGKGECEHTCEAVRDKMAGGLVSEPQETEKALGIHEEETSRPVDLYNVAQPQEPDVIDGECKECCVSAADTPVSAAETQRKDIDVLRDMLMKEKLDLEEHMKIDKAEPLPPEMLRKKKLLVGALANMLCDMEEMEEQEEEPQPELPLFRNNDQRKEWLRNYKDWGIWYEDEHIGAKYYRYQFDNGAVLIAEEYHEPETRYMSERDASYLHLIGGPEPPKDKQGIGKWQRNDRYRKYPNSETELVEFLKEVQKK